MEDNREGTQKRLANLIPFKEGESGNPAGRPKGSKNLSTILKEMLSEEIEVNIDGEKTKKKFADIIVRKLVKKAHDGDLRAIQEIFDRTEGKAKQEVNGDFQHKLEITWNEPADINLPDTTNKGSNGVVQGLPGGIQDNS